MIARKPHRIMIEPMEQGIVGSFVKYVDLTDYLWCLKGNLRILLLKIRS